MSLPRLIVGIRHCRILALGNNSDATQALYPNASPDPTEYDRAPYVISFYQMSIIKLAKIQAEKYPANIAGCLETEALFFNLK